MNSLFYLVVGIGVAGFWTLLIATGGMDFQRTGTVPSVFHLTSEGILAILCIITGTGLLRRSVRSRRWYFLSVGTLLSSVMAAASFYAVDDHEGDPAMVVLFGIISVIATVLLLVSVRRMVDPSPGGGRRAALLASGGMLVYAVLNVCGMLLGTPGANPGQVAALAGGAVVLAVALLSIVLRGAAASPPDVR